MLNLERQGDEARLGPFLQSLTLPHANEWFTSNFGDQGCGSSRKGPDDCMGPRLAVSYALTTKTLPAAAVLTLSDLLDEKLTNVEAVNYTEPCPGPQRIHPARKLDDELTTTPILSSVLSGLVRNQVPVYVLWAYSDTQETTVTFFVYSEGSFRYIGAPYPATWSDFDRASSTSDSSQSSSAASSSGDLTNEVLDVQPVRVDSALIQTSVVVHVMIEADGSVSSASYVRGPEQFKDAAIKYAREHNFGAQGFFGHPVRTDTCISVNPRQ